VCVALGIQHAMRMRHIIYLWPARLYKIFPHYLINGMINENEVIEYKMRVLILSTTFFIL